MFIHPKASHFARRVTLSCVSEIFELHLQCGSYMITGTTMRFQYVIAAAFVAAIPAGAQLDKWAKAAGLKYFGTAVDNPSLGNGAYMKIVRDTAEFGQVTPANSQKWSNTEPGQGQFSFGGGDAIANVVRQSGQLLRCHTLVWYNQLPGWGMSLQANLLGCRAESIIVGGGLGKDQMQRVVTSHVQNVVTHYKGQCYSWDVVNESLEDDGKYRQNPSRLFLDA